jgi:starch synthase
MPATLRILFLAAEAEPFIKIGGLADVAGSLPLALRSVPQEVNNDVLLDVRLVLPLHAAIRIKEAVLHQVAEFPVHRQGGDLQSQVFETSLAGMPVYFIDGTPISKATSIYSLDPAQDREKYAFFSMAALEFTRQMGWQPDILHANDWHTALALYALRSRRSDPMLSRVRSVLTVHNLPYMGGDGTDVLAAYGLETPCDEALPAWGRTQPLPLGLWSADALVAVSQGYAREILSPEFGCGLDSFLRSRSGSITGILNGLDQTAWDPETDKSLPGNFGLEHLSERALNKTALLHELGLQEELHTPLLAMIGRMDWQKGVDITFEVLRRMKDQPWQFIILGSGDPNLENAARALQAENPERIKVEIGYNARLSRLIYGGADMLLMPSRYEPCGLAQMIAMRYGCVPVVHATGGLKDTVQDDQTGFLFQEAASGSMLEGLKRAMSIYASKVRWENIQRKGMQADFSWSHSAVQYATLYRSLTLDKGS